MIRKNVYDSRQNVVFDFVQEKIVFFQEKIVVSSVLNITRPKLISSILSLGRYEEDLKVPYRRRYDVAIFICGRTFLIEYPFEISERMFINFIQLHLC